MGSARSPIQIILASTRFERINTKQGTVMANIKSQKKRILTNAKRQERNKAVKSELKTRVKSAVRTGVADPAGDGGDDLKMAIKRLDKAATKGVIHKNQAANRKSKLMRRLAKASA